MKEVTDNQQLATVLAMFGANVVQPGDLVEYESRRRKETRVGVVLAVEPLAVGARAHCFGEFVPHATVQIAREDGVAEVRRCRVNRLTVVTAAKPEEPVLMADCPVRDVVDGDGEPVAFDVRKAEFQPA
jgi:hypothetical protein